MFLNQIYSNLLVIPRFVVTSQTIAARRILGRGRRTRAGQSWLQFSF